MWQLTKSFYTSVTYPWYVLLGLPNSTWDFNTIFMIPLCSLRTQLSYPLLVDNTCSIVQILYQQHIVLLSFLLIFKTVTKVEPQLMLNIGNLCWVWSPQRDVAKAKEQTPISLAPCCSWTGWKRTVISSWSVNNTVAISALALNDSPVHCIQSNISTVAIAQPTLLAVTQWFSLMWSTCSDWDTGDNGPIKSIPIWYHGERTGIGYRV